MIAAGQATTNEVEAEIRELNKQVCRLCKKKGHQETCSTYNTLRRVEPSACFDFEARLKMKTAAEKDDGSSDEVDSIVEKTKRAKKAKEKQGNRLRENGKWNYSFG